MNSVMVPAYAKVNLFLDVVGKCPDGYHELVTLFERIDLADRLTLEWISEDRVEICCKHPEVPQDGTNLVARAAQGYRRAAGITQGVRITLEKQIPVGGGLGGGSSDAAATLLALQQLTDNRLDRKELVSLGRELGADVPFFLYETGWALGRERGDKLEPLEISAHLWQLLIFPKFPVPTRQVYGAFVLTGNHPDVRMLIRALRGQTQVSRVRELLFNALEPTVEHLYPALRDVKRTLQTIGLERPLVSGSGATVLAVCDSGAQAQEASRILQGQNPGWQFFVTSTMG